MNAIGYFKDALDAAEKCLRIAAVIVGGVWTYYGFVKGRIYRPRLELSVVGKALKHDDGDYIVASLLLKNIGTAKVDLDRENSGLRIYSCELFEKVEAPDTVDWTRISTFPVFEDSIGWLESGEAFQDNLLISVPSSRIAIKLRLRVVAAKLEWWAETVV